MLLADRGYDADWIKELARQQGAWADIPPKRNRKDSICFSPYLYRSRNLVERFFNKIKQCRRIATRYDKLAVNCLTFVKLASIRIWLHVNESRPNNESARPKIYDRMISERRQIAERFLSKGNGEAARIRGNRVRDLNKIQSEARRQVDEICDVAVAPLLLNTDAR